MAHLIPIPSFPKDFKSGENNARQHAQKKAARTEAWATLKTSEAWRLETAATLT
jgi:hypothetical protein